MSAAIFPDGVYGGATATTAYLLQYILNPRNVFAGNYTGSLL